MKLQTLWKILFFGFAGIQIAVYLLYTYSGSGLSITPAIYWRDLYLRFGSWRNISSLEGSAYTLWYYISTLLGLDNGSRVNYDIAVFNFFGNLLKFMPNGLLFPLIFRGVKLRWAMAMIWGLVFSLLLETLQLVTALGIFDLADVVLNLLGYLMGYLMGCGMCALFLPLWEKWRRSHPVSLRDHEDEVELEEIL
ncbi:MAG: VanZ family protein [Oscillospiraceae bacterium]|nr:VanZ family protein [Oscillospiraceae bacterium]